MFHHSVTNYNHILRLVIYRITSTTSVQYFIRNDAHIQNTIQNVGIRKQEDLYKSVSLIQMGKIKQVLK
jgi:hypothetical protein